MSTGPTAAPTLAPAPPEPDPPRRRRRLLLGRWWLLPLTAGALALGTTVALATNGDLPGRQAPPGTDATGGKAGLGPAATGSRPTPGGNEGFGAGPKSGSPSPSVSGGTTSGGFPGSRNTLPGASIYLQNGESFAAGLARSDRSYGPLRMVRVFYPGLPPSWSGSRADVADRTVVVSFKAPPGEVAAGKHDSRLTSWFRSVPRDLDVYWSYFHEPEDDIERGSYTAAQYRSAWKRLADLADRAGNARLRSTLILMCWTLNPNSRRSFDDYWPGGEAIDVLGWDCYNSGGKYDRYTDPAQVFTPMINKSKALGKPWGLAETGSVRIAGDSSGTGRAAWIRSMSRYLDAQRPLWVAYYDYEVAGGDFRLLDAPSREAWRAWCAAS
ncbi:hypothetical protein GA0070558_10335 [Micromonospora haikouensis]|uniref:GH26 domain-containing protein n=1 Tax=Micromonospora haikouensis TaxID=686309 RepID=A0A1C4UCH6_9ACTN|nr:hypothetical protein [Micromonospora haikouensis]SCE69366.1 hypothetical protein GA0070558_10335 [Micromonospora haikouensis]